MNNKERLKQKFNKRKHSKTLKGIAFILVFAILISSAYAFLTAHQTKNNVFTLGNIKLELHEDGWESNQSLTDIVKDGTKYKNGKDYINSSKLKNVVPDEPITKDPKILNVGSNPADVYISVDMCTALVDGEYVDIFETNYDSNTSKWKLYKTENGNNGRHIYYYSYDETLYSTEETDTLFSTVTLKSELYDLLDISTDYTIVVNGFGIQQGAEPGEDVFPFPLPVRYNLSYIREDGSLYAKEKKEPGEPIEMKFDASLAKEGFSFDWIDENGEAAYEGMTMPSKDFVLNANYLQVANLPVSYGKISYEVIKYNDQLALRAIRVFDSCTDEEIVIPSVVVFNSGDGLTQIHSVTNDLIRDSSSYLEKNTEYTLPVKSVSMNTWNEYTKKLILSDGIEEFISTNEGEGFRTNNIEEIVLPYGLKNLNNTHKDRRGYDYFVNLKNINIPHTLEEFCFSIVDMTEVESLVVPKNVKKLIDPLQGDVAYSNLKHLTLDCDLYYPYEVNYSGLETLTINGNFYDTIYNGHPFFIKGKTMPNLKEIIVNGNITTELRVDGGDALNSKEKITISGNEMLNSIYVGGYRKITYNCPFKDKTIGVGYNSDYEVNIKKEIQNITFKPYFIYGGQTVINYYGSEDDFYAHLTNPEAFDNFLNSEYMHNNRFTINYNASF